MFRSLLAATPCVVLLSACAANAPSSASATAVDPRAANGQVQLTGPIRWESWSDDLFARAKAENRFVLLDLEAVWCHWCHVMEETTYADREVASLVGQRFIAVRVDQDSRPDLSNRYEDYGWPATVVFAPDGTEIVKRSGYIEPPAMVSMLRAILADPTPGPSVEPALVIAYSKDGRLDADLEDEITAYHRERYDFVNGGFGFVHKYLDASSLEYAIARALDGNAEAERMARQTLDAATALVDPVWGGVYQYSTGGHWDEPHFEKIMAFQADALRIYSLAHSAWAEPRYLKAARDVERFLRTFLLSPEGAFFTSMDADLVPGEHAGEYFALDDEARRARGVPRIDRHLYARENGQAIRGLCALYATTGDAAVLELATRAARWVIEHRSLEGGGFRHDEVDAAGPYLGDTIAMGQAFLALYETTGERAWLARAEAASDFISNRFASAPGGAGFVTVEPRGGGALAPQPPQRDENVAVARFENLLAHYGGRKEHRGRAERALRFLATREIATRGLPGGVLLADRELASDPLHLMVVGAKSDPGALALFRAALALPSTYRRIEWADPAEGALPNADVEYPDLGRAAAFACAHGRCSSPAFAPEDVAKRASALRP